MDKVVYIVYHCNSVKREFRFAISYTELRPTLVSLLCVYALFSLTSSTSSHSVWSDNVPSWSAVLGKTGEWSTHLSR